MTLVGQIAELQNYATYKELSWEGSFEDYLALVRRSPHVTRNAYQRLYDMVLSHGVEEYIDNKKKLTRYKFFRDDTHGALRVAMDATDHAGQLNQEQCRQYQRRAIRT